MKAFKTYLAENTRTYEFRIKLACEVDNECINKLKQTLEAYQLDSISKPKRLPVHEHPDFPQCGPTEVNIIDVKLHYPVTSAQLRAIVGERCAIQLSCIRVIAGGENNPYEKIQAGKEQSKEWKEGDAVLNQEEMVTEAPAEDLVGTKRLPTIMQELEATRRYKYEFEQASNEAGKTTNDLPQGEKGPLSTQNTIPNPYKGK